MKKGYLLLVIICGGTFGISAQQKQKIIQKPQTKIVAQQPQSISKPANQILESTKPNTPEILKNNDIILLAKHGFEDSVIISLIQTKETLFDTSLNALIQLKEAGISSKVMDAMLATVPTKKAQASESAVNKPAAVVTKDQSLKSTPAVTPLKAASISGEEASGLHAKKIRRLEDSTKIQNVSGGSVLKTKLDYDQTYKTILNFLKGRGYTLDSASQDSGQIITAIKVSGFYRQTGTRCQISIYTETDDSISVRVSVTEQKRFKALQTEPWGDISVNEKKSEKLSTEIDAELRNVK